ncbi:MAG TPA: thiol:disulfide interchange protein DsbA/DsbL [Rhodanobacteraceae bacterium]|jgi:thiol:disulfide interchange protein DsbA|nr:thiol:disulfide interchange protein DsbA/DsbL [Rhodanobacteraceae bacterium]
MLKHLAALLIGLAILPAANAQQAGKPQAWEAGKQYFLVEPPQPTTTGDKIEVLEVFSYACPACNQFRSFANAIKSALPANAEMTYLPAAFRADEDWPVFQRAFFAAQSLGLVDKTHDAMFDAVWKDGSLKINDPVTRRLVNPLPTIEDVAKFYANYGVKAEDFVGVANSFAVNTKMKRADAQIKAYGVDSTPTIIVNGKYRLTGVSAGGWDKVPLLVKYLVEQESHK